MTYLISQLWLYLLAAGLLGLLLGWIIWGWRSRQMIADLKAEQQKEQVALKRAFETEKLALEEDRAAAFRSRDDALKLKASLIGELEGERKVVSEAKAQIGRLTQAELASRGEFERTLQVLQERVEKERSTAEEAKQTVEAIREDVREEQEQRQTALSNAERAQEALRARLGDMEAQAKQARVSLEQRVAEEQTEKAALQLELRRDRAELSGVKDALDSLHADMNRQLETKDLAVVNAEKGMALARRETESTRGELDRLKAESGSSHEEALKALEQGLNEERLTKVMLETEVERLSKKLASVSSGSQSNGAEAERISSERDDALRRQRTLEAELDRLKALLKQREAESAKPAPKTFTTDAPRPASLYDRRPDIVDDLKVVKGIGPVMERVLNEKGCYHFKQLANFSKRDIEWISVALGSFPDRIERDNWVGQAQTLYARKYGQRHDVGAVSAFRTLEMMS